MLFKVQLHLINCKNVLLFFLQSENNQLINRLQKINVTRSSFSAGERHHITSGDVLCPERPADAHPEGQEGRAPATLQRAHR